ncbi:MAG: TonB-dependent receptor plug domain-containing protein [Phycisphaerales bacterium]|nr:TonB-dependent receptor plug domain-containing protein [Phycisphaerales bacterium]
MVQPGQLTDVDMYLSGEFVEMEEFIVQDVQLGTSTEAGLLELRADAPALLDSVSSELISRAGASDAAAALSLVAGATVSDGKFAVIRGLPDRYVVSLLNNVRLPSADAETRAVELDQFPSTVIDSIQVSKTFTPDQQGDASGGAVNVVLKGIPDENVIQFSASTSINTNDPGDGEFLTYKGGGVNFWGFDDGGRAIQSEFYNPAGSDGFYNGAKGVSRGDAPINYKWSATAGGNRELADGWRTGGVISFYYDQGSSYFDNGVKDDLGIGDIGQVPLGTPPGGYAPRWGNYFGTPRASLFDVEQGSQEVKWGGLATAGLENEFNRFKIVYMYAHSAEDTARVEQDTRSSTEWWPNLDDNSFLKQFVFSPTDIPNYFRNESLTYVERTTQSLQFSGEHTLPVLDESGEVTFFRLENPEFSWFYAQSSTRRYEPDKRLFSSIYLPASGQHQTRLTGGSIGNFNRIWQDIEEESNQYTMDVKLPFRQWSDSAGYFKIGLFNDRVERSYLQDSFSNRNEFVDGFPVPYDAPLRIISVILPKAFPIYWVMTQWMWIIEVGKIWMPGI